MSALVLGPEVLAMVEHVGRGTSVGDVDDAAAEPAQATKPRRREPRVRETPEVAAAAARMIRAVGVRAGTDVDALELLEELRVLIEQTMSDAAQECRRNGWSWTDVGRVLGITRQSARERLGRRP